MWKCLLGGAVPSTFVYFWNSGWCLCQFYAIIRSVCFNFWKKSSFCEDKAGGDTHYPCIVLWHSALCKYQGTALKSFFLLLFFFLFLFGPRCYIVNWRLFCTEHLQEERATALKDCAHGCIMVMLCWKLPHWKLFAIKLFLKCRLPSVA